MTAAAAPTPDGGRPPSLPDTLALPPRASLARRLAALAYEATIVSALFLVAAFLSLPLLPPTNGVTPPLRIPDLPARVLSFGILFAAGALYCVWSWTAGRRTLSMKTWRLAIVRADGQALDRRTALTRYVAGWIGPALAVAAYAALRPTGFRGMAAGLLALNILWAVVDPDRQFLHDRIAGTRIVAG